MLANYDFITADTRGCFTPRRHQAPIDTEFALDYVKEHARTPEQQEAVLTVLRAKYDILWAMLDALHLA
jgi:pyrroloquinoline-quinone synthase